MNFKRISFLIAVIAIILFSLPKVLGEGNKAIDKLVFDPSGNTSAALTPVPNVQMPTGSPGFESLFAIAGLLAVAYIILRQRE